MSASEDNPTSGAEAAQAALDDRKAAILKAVVTDYVETSLPVGSAQVARDPLVDVSPATVRADMAALERDGYLTHPHTSAGRVPTDKGYRFYVDHLAPPLPLGESQQEQVQEFFSRAHGEIERMLADTSRLLAQLTDTAAIVVPPGHEQLVVRSAILTRLSAKMALLVIVLSNGTIDRHQVMIEEEVPDTDLRAASNYLDEHFANRSTGQLAGEVVLPPSGRPEVDALVELARRSLGSQDRPEHVPEQVFVGGAARMIEHFEAVEQVRAVMSILEQSFVVVSLLHDVLLKGQSVSIGSEHGVAPLAECSLVVAPFGGEGEAGGTIGILGPTRMDYPQALAAVAVVGQRLSRELERG
ncbi:MAG TPA: heat-inducible transcriptional repressor HrcA, partial [Acidimicrobiales bacterium]|nr:heat-inducible transcriptional repressor HrcA [Acidimicrobiales bacterium]